MEERKEVKTIRVNFKCPKCEKGFLIPTGTCLTSNPPVYPHKCNSCEYGENFSGVCYPYTEYVDLNTNKEVESNTPASPANNIKPDQKEVTFGHDSKFSHEMLPTIFKNIRIGKGVLGSQHVYLVKEEKGDVAEIHYMSDWKEWHIILDNFPMQKKVYKTSFPINTVSDFISEMNRIGLRLHTGQAPTDTEILNNAHDFLCNHATNIQYLHYSSDKTSDTKMMVAEIMKDYADHLIQQHVKLDQSGSCIKKCAEWPKCNPCGQIDKFEIGELRNFARFLQNFRLVTSEKRQESAWIDISKNPVYVNGSDHHFAELIQNHGLTLDRVIKQFKNREA